MHFYISISVLLVFVACSTKPKELPQPQELSTSPVYKKLIQELDSTEIYDDSIIYGYWFKPLDACAVNVFFHKDGTFEFKFYIVENDSTITDVVKKGTYTIGDEDVNKTCLIKMVDDDGLFFGKMYRKHNRTHYYLTNKRGDLYMVKGSD